jgi:hypothetical protein
VDLFYPPDLTGGEFDLDPVGVKRRFGEESLHDAFGEFSGTLVVLLYDRNVLSRSDIVSLASVHGGEITTKRGVSAPREIGSWGLLGVSVGS